MSSLIPLILDYYKEPLSPKFISSVLYDANVIFKKELGSPIVENDEACFVDRSIVITDIYVKLTSREHIPGIAYDNGTGNVILDKEWNESFSPYPWSFEDQQYEVLLRVMKGTPKSGGI